MIIKAYSWHQRIPKENKDTKAYSLSEFRFFPKITLILQILILEKFLKFFAEIPWFVFV